jgi:hypothetical protein
MSLTQSRSSIERGALNSSPYIHALAPALSHQLKSTDSQGNPMFFSHIPSPVLPHHPQVTSYLLLFWTLYVNRIPQRMALCDIHIVFSRLLLVAPCWGFIPLHCQVICAVWTDHILFHYCLMDTCVFLPFGCQEYCCSICEPHVRSWGPEHSCPHSVAQAGTVTCLLSVPFPLTCSLYSRAAF